MPSEKDMIKVFNLQDNTDNVCENTVVTHQSEIIPVYPTEVAIKESYATSIASVSDIYMIKMMKHLFSCPQIRTTLSALDLWRDPSGVAALLDDWREKLAANPHKTTEADSLQ